MAEELLRIRGLKTHFYTEAGIVPALDGVDLGIARSKTLGLVGESGCGKSVTALSIMGLIPGSSGKVANGEIFFGGSNLLDKTPAQMRAIRGNDISMIFQEPMSALNPVLTIGFQIMESFMVHQNLEKKEARKKAVEMLDLVGIPSAQRRVGEFPHQMSGGMRQRVMIAMALACNPQLLIADEPTTALDVTIQAQILELMKQLQRDLGTSILMITHDLGVIAEMAQDVAVMYLGQIVEQGTVVKLFDNPLHPYTKGLLGSIPKINVKQRRLQVIQGSVPQPGTLIKGCRFQPRCNVVMPICHQKEPILQDIRDGHSVRCWQEV